MSLSVVYFSTVYEERWSQGVFPGVWQEMRESDTEAGD